MPKIPTYTTSVDYKPPRGDLETAAAPGLALAKFGEAVGDYGGKIVRQIDMAERLKRAEDEAIRANGTAQAMADLRQTIANFDADTDPDTMMERYQAQTDGIRQGIADRFGDPHLHAQVEEDTAASFGLQAALLQGDQVRRMAAQGRRDLDDHLALYSGIAANARHPLEHDEAINLGVSAIRRKAEAGFVTAEDAANLERTFYADVSERQARHAIAADPERALASLKGDEDFAALPADRRVRLIDEAGRAVQAQIVARTTAAAEVRRDTLIRLPGFVDALRDGELPDDDTRFSRDHLIATFGAAEGAARWTEIEEARAFGKETARVKWATPDEIAGLLGADPDTDPTAPDGAAPNRSPLAQAVERRNEQLWSKPADYALANPRIAELHKALTQATAQPQLPAAMTAVLQAGGAPMPDAAAGDTRRAATAAYANATLAEQERLGLPEDRRQVLPAADAQALVARILEGDPKAAADMLSDLIADWGDAAPTTLADLGRHGLPGEYRLLASFDDPVARQTFAKVLTAQAAEPGALRSKAGEDAEVIDQVLSTDLPLVSDPIGGDYGVSANKEPTIAGLGEPAENELVDMLRPMTQVRPENPGYSKSNVMLASLLPPVDPQDAVRRENELKDKAWKLGRRPRWMPPPPPPLPTAKLLVDNQGEPIMVWDPELKEDVWVQMPDNVDLKHFAAMGKAHGPALALPNLVNFFQGHSWDLQRPNWQRDRFGRLFGPFVDKYRDVSTIAIGVYAAAAGLPEEMLQRLQQSYAAISSSFSKDDPVDDDYAPLPRRNVNNMRLGYTLYQTGRITP